jgi:6-pyruvoyltetrahydropterin/6-carboxytetrahydropterin synthase
MFTVCVRSHFMIAHSFRGELFGPAQKLHGATYVVDVEFRRPELGPEGVVVDIGRATSALEALLGELTYKNLDDDPTLAGKNTTTEYLSRVVFDRMKARIAAGALGAGGDRIDSVKVTLHESHVAWASYEGAVR